MTQNNNLTFECGTFSQLIVDELHFDDELMEMDSFDLNTGDLSEWLDPQHDSSTTIEELPLTDMELGSCSFDEDIFKDCKEELENEEESALDFSRKSSTFSRKRIRTLSPERSSPCQQLSCETPPAYPQTYLNATPVTSGEVLYNTTLHNLTSSMERSEMSRAQVLGHRASLSNLPRQPSPSSMNSLPALLSGKRTALTAGLEESRNQLRRYMSLININ